MFGKSTKIKYSMLRRNDTFFKITTKSVKLQPTQFMENVIHTPLGNMHIKFNFKIDLRLKKTFDKLN